MPNQVNENRTLVPDGDLKKKTKSGKFRNMLLIFVIILAFVGLVSLFFAMMSRKTVEEQLVCYHCEASLNLPNRTSELPQDTGCWGKPTNKTKCEKNQICGSFYQALSNDAGVNIKLIQRSCYENSNLGCDNGVVKGIHEISCRCNEPLCIPIRHSR